MAATLLRLKLQLLANQFRRNRGQLAVLVLGIVVGLGIVGAGVFLLLQLRDANVAPARTAIVLAGSLLVLVFLVGPLFTGTEDALDPRRFAGFGLPTRTLARGLFLSALIGVPAVAVAIWTLATIGTWARSPGSVVLAVVCAPIVVATCVLAARVTAGLASLSIATRRPRDWLTLVAIVAVVVALPLVVLGVETGWGAQGTVRLPDLAEALSWTPLGAAFAVPADAAAGEYGSGLLKLAIAIATVALLWIGWAAVVRGLLRSVDRPGRARSYGTAGWFDRLPARPASVIAARSLTYWGRDPRYVISLAIIPIVPIVMVAALGVAGVPSAILALLPLPTVCLLLGWSVHNDLAADSTAIWLHISSATRGSADRWGRLFPVLALGVPLVVVGAVVSAIFHGSWDVLPGLLGVSTSLLLCGAGLSSFMSAAFLYPTTRPGDSPFTHPQSTGAIAVFVQAATLLVPLALSGPAIWLFVLGIVSDPSMQYLALLVGVIVGVIVLVAGVAAGGRTFERRGPEILAAAQLFD